MEMTGHLGGDGVLVRIIPDGSGSYPEYLLVRADRVRLSALSRLLEKRGDRRSSGVPVR